MKQLILVMAVLVSTSSFAAELTLQARAYQPSCSYFTAVRGEADIRFVDKTLPWGTEITLLHGWAGETHSYGRPSKPQDLEWYETAEVPVMAVAPYTWGVQVSHNMIERSNPTRLHSLDFVLKIRLPNGNVRFEKGSASPEGFYRARVFNPGTIPCVKPGEPLPKFEDAAIETIVR